MKKDLIVLFLSLLLLLSCNKKDSLENMRLEKYLDKNFVIELDSFNENFDLFLKKKYPQISESDQIKRFLTEFYEYFILEDSKDLENFICSFNFFDKNIDSLKSNGYFDTIKNDDKVLYRALEWRYNTFYNNNLLNIDSIIKKDIVDGKRDFKSNLNFYYGIYSIAKSNNDSITMNWVNSKIKTQSSFPSIAYIRTLPNDYLNSILCKTMIVNEFILPFYNFKEQKFILDL